MPSQLQRIYTHINLMVGKPLTPNSAKIVQTCMSFQQHSKACMGIPAPQKVQGESGFIL